MSDVFTLNASMATLVKAQAAALCAADLNVENTVAAVAQALRPALTNDKGEVCTYAQWEAVRTGFIAAYQGARRCEEKTAINRWQAVATWLADSATPLKKPAAATPASAKQADKRAKLDKAADAAIKAHKGDLPALQAAVSAAVDKPDQFRVLKHAADKLADKLASEAKAKAKEHEASLRDEARELLKLATGDMLARMVEAMRAVAKDNPAIKSGKGIKDIPATTRAKKGSGAIGAMVDAIGAATH